VSCSDESISLKLPDYVSGHLDEPDRTSVVAHLAVCEECRRSLDVMVLLSEGGNSARKTGSQSHPSVRLLTQYYEDPARVDPAARQAINEHLRECGDCAHEMDFLKGLEGLLSVPERAVTRSAWPRLAGWLRRPMPAFSVAAAVLAGLMLILFEAVPHPERGPVGGTVVVYNLHELMRGQEAILSIERRSGTRVVHLALVHTIRRTSCEYQVRVSDARETKVWLSGLHPDLTQLDHIAVDLDTQTLPDGNYVVIVSEIPTSTPSESTQSRFPFELKSTR
jgi:hypothetical protein